jgi:hypothetical protein
MCQQNNQSNNVEIADILKMQINELRNITTNYEKKVLSDIISCRTSVLGGHKLQCDKCNYTEISYNSCRNRNCPKCQGASALRWVKKQMEDILPVQYFHIVFTVPNILDDIILYNKVKAYSLLFKAVSKTLKDVAANKTNLDAKIGFISVLHTWEQRLNFHPHIHCIVPGGGLTKYNNKWISCKKDYFLPVIKLSKVFRGKLLSYFEKAYKSGELNFTGKMKSLNNKDTFIEILKKSCSNDWVVYSKKPFADPKQVFNYLGRYTHRIGISNNRIVSFTNNTVTFKWRDRRNNNESKLLTLDIMLFIKRFLLHILPSGFMKIRYYGFLGNRYKKELVSKCKECLLAINKKKKEKTDAIIKDTFIYFGCPECDEGKLILVAISFASRINSYKGTG